MDNPEEVLHILDEFAKLKPKDIPKELEDYLSYVARTGDPVYQWSLVKCLFREKLLRVITDFYESTALINPPSPAGDNFNYEGMKRVLLERLETFSNAPFTVQRLCELLTAPRKQYNRTDKFMRAIEKNILVVSTREPGSACRQENAMSEPLPNGVSDGESLTQSVKNETAHLAEAHLNENEEGSLNEERHVDIGSIEAENSVATVAPKDVEAGTAELSNSSEESSSSGEKVSGESGTELDDESSKAPVSNEILVVHQNQIVENIESTCTSDSAAQSTECVESTDETAVEEENVSDEQLVEQSVEQEELKDESEHVESVKEDAAINENEIVCESKSDEISAEEVNENGSEVVEKPEIDDSDVSCSTSDTPSWTPTVSEEQDCVSTTEAVSVESSSEVVQDSGLSAEAVDATSSEVVPESSETSEVECVKPSETLEVFKDIGSSSDSLVSTDNESKEDDGVGTTDTAVIEEPVAASSDESQSQSPVTEEANQPEESPEVTTEADASTVDETPAPKTNVVEENVEVPVVSPEVESLDSKSVDVSSATESCPENETSKEAVPAVSEEAMDVDEANSCHSTGTGIETDEMTVADQSEPMDDSE